MGWAKYMEDDMEIMQTRNANWNLYDFSYPQTQIAKPKKAPSAVPSPSDHDILASVLAGFLDSSSVMREDEYKDKNLICKCCGRPFLFSVSKQRFFAKEGWNPPKRCKRCRELREVTFCMRPSF